MPLYEIATLTIAVGTLAKALPRIEAYVAQGPARGTLRACLHCDLGALNEILIIRDFADTEARLAERDCLAAAGNAFGIGEFTTAMRAETFRLFPWLPPIADGVWPPKGGVDSLLAMKNGIYLPAPFSPLK